MLNYHLGNDLFSQETSFRKKKLPERRFKVYEECPICIQEINHDMIVNSCGHSYHTQCLKMDLIEKINQKAIPLKCFEQNCKKKIDQRVARTVVDNRDYEKLLNFEYQIITEFKKSNIIKCFLPRCDYYFIKDFRFINPKEPIFIICQKCKKELCVQCHTVKHVGTCAQNKQSQNLQYQLDSIKEYMQNNKLKKCPSCGVLVEKNKGCNHITCKCRHEFCYKCGVSYKGSKAACRCPIFDETS